MKISFGKIDHVVVIGGSWVAAEFLKILSKSKFSFCLISSERHMNDIVDSNGLTLREFSSLNNIKFHLSSDINNDNYLQRFIKKNTLAVAMGAPWVFDKKIVKFFDNKIVDFMGIPLPEYRGGAHYTWQILSNNRNGACNIQLINGGKNSFHKGPIVKSNKYLFPKKSFTPQDYFIYALKKESFFLRNFLKEIKDEKEFNTISLNEKNSSYYPFLNTKKNGWINWSWKSEELIKFINAFGDPYSGASTLLKGERVFIKDVKIKSKIQDFHPFHAGLVIKKEKYESQVISNNKILVIKGFYDENENNIINKVKEGDRLYTSNNILDEAMSFEAKYDASGLKK